MSILAIDIGNTAIKLGLFDGKQLLYRETIADLNQLTESLLKIQPYLVDRKLDIAVSSVVPQTAAQLRTIVTDTLEASTTLHWTWLTRETLAHKIGPLDISAYEDGQIGADRVANMLGAIEAFPDQNCLVIGIGTMTTFNLIDKTGRYMGGAITPGPAKFLSLTGKAHTAQLLSVEHFSAPNAAFGRSTQECLDIGLYRGYQGLLQNIIQSLLTAAGETQANTTLVLTGGDSKVLTTMLQENLSMAIHDDPDLTLKGIAYYLQISQLPEFQK